MNSVANGRRIWTFALLLAVCLAPGMAAVANAEYSMGDFARIMADAAKSSPSNRVETEDGAVPIVGGFTEGERSGDWEVAISYAYMSGDYTVTTVTYPGDLKFDGTSLQYAFAGPSIYFDDPEIVYNHKGMQKAIKAWIKKHQDLNMQVALDDDTVVLTAQCAVGSLNEGDVFDRFKALFIASHGVIWWSEVAEKEVEEEYVKNLAKMKLDYMTPMALRELTSGFVPIEREGVAEGAWDHSSPYSGAADIYLNYGDRVVFEHVPPFVFMTDAERASVLPAIEKWVEKNKLKKTEVDVRVEGENPSRIVVSTAVRMDGKLKGKDFAKLEEKYSVDWLGDLWFKVTRDPYIQFIDAYKGETPQHLDNRLFFLSLGDDFSHWQRAAPEGALGHWVLVYESHKATISKKYATNYGDRIEIVFGKPLLEKSRAEAEAALGLAENWLRGKGVPNATLAGPELVESNPEDIGSISDRALELQLSLTIPIGALTAAEIGEAHKYFWYTLRRELDEMLNEKLEISEW